MNRRKNEKSFSILFIIVVAVALIVVLGIIVLLIYLFNLGELLEIYIDKDLRWFVILIWIVSSITVGLGVSMWFGQIIMKPVNRMIKGMTQLSDGIYDTKIYIGKRNALKDLSDCFNKLALELKKHDSMSNDFINNFSHELKTPLVSISGLIKLLQDENVSEEKKKEYLQIIDEESSRLATMTTNILSLSKLENQEILTDKEKINISEQIRTTILLLEKKLEHKKLELSIDFDEYYIYGNSDLLKEVWLNLIDNAIKYSYEETVLEINIKQNNNLLQIDFINVGDTIKPEEIENIFKKFYRGKNNKSHDGNGIGLSIVSKIVELHNGTIKVQSKDNMTTFSIEFKL